MRLLVRSVCIAALFSAPATSVCAQSPNTAASTVIVTDQTGGVLSRAQTTYGDTDTVNSTFG